MTQTRLDGGFPGMLGDRGPRQRRNAPRPTVASRDAFLGKDIDPSTSPFIRDNPFHLVSALSSGLLPGAKISSPLKPEGHEEVKTIRHVLPEASGDLYERQSQDQDTQHTAGLSVAKRIPTNRATPSPTTRTCMRLRKFIVRERSMNSSS